MGHEDLYCIVLLHILQTAGIYLWVGTVARFKAKGWTYAISYSPHIILDFPGDLVVKNPPVMQETWVGFLGWEDPLEKEMATHSSILTWEIPWTEEPGRLQSMGLQRVGQNIAPEHACKAHNPEETLTTIQQMRK